MDLAWTVLGEETNKELLVLLAWVGISTLVSSE